MRRSSLKAIAEKFRQACATENIVMWVEAHPADPSGHVATLSPGGMHEGAVVLSMIGSGKLQLLGRKPEDYCFVLQSHRDDKEEFDRFRTLTAEAGATIISRRFLKHMGVISFTGPQAVWFCFLLRFGSPTETNGYFTISQVYAQSILAIDRALEPESEPKDGDLQVTRQSQFPSPGHRPLKCPPDEALAAWRLRFSTGAKQQKIAALLEQQLSRPIGQPQVSRWLKQVDAFLKAGNVLPEPPKRSAKTHSFDPATLDSGGRIDRITPRQRQLRSDE